MGNMYFTRDKHNPSKITEVWMEGESPFIWTWEVLEQATGIKNGGREGQYIPFMGMGFVIQYVETPCNRSYLTRIS